MISIRVSLVSAVIALSSASLFSAGLTKCASVQRDMGRLCPSVAFASSPTPCSMLAEKVAENNEQTPRVFMAVVNEAKSSAKAPIKTYVDAALIGELQEAVSNVRQISNDSKWEENVSIKVACIAKALKALDSAQSSKNDEVQSLSVRLTDLLVSRLRQVLTSLGKIINDPEWHGTTALNEQYVLAAMDYANLAKQSSCLLIRWLAKNIAKNCAHIVPNVAQDQGFFDASYDFDESHDLTDIDSDTDVDDEVALICSPDFSDDDDDDDDDVLDREDAMLASLRKAFRAQADDRKRCLVQ